MSCYYPDGDLGEGLIPCNTTAVVSHCCRAGDLCVKNGFCFSTGLSALVRRGCTDPNFNGTCPQQCTTGDKFRSADVVLTPCDQPYTFACGVDATARNSCTTGNGSFNIQAGSAGIIIGGDNSGPAVTVSTTLPGTATITATATSTSTLAAAANSKDCGSEKTTTIGVGAGLGAGILIAAATAAWFFWKWQKAEKRIKRRGLDWVEEPANNGAELNGRR